MKDRIEKFLDGKEEAINKLAEKYPDEKSLVLDWQDLEKFDSEIAELLLTNPYGITYDSTGKKTPRGIIDIFEHALHERNIPVLETGASGTPEFHVRFNNLPKEKPYSLMVRFIDSETIAHFVSTEGVVNRISEVLPKLYVAKFKCKGCGQSMEMPQDREDRLRGQILTPTRCRDCGKMDFQFLPEDSQWLDFQILEIQEPLEYIKGGEQARKIKIWVEDDMTDRVTAGDKVTLTGVIRLQPPQKKGSVYYKFIEANYIEPLEKEFEDIDITKKEEKEIQKISKDPEVYTKIVDSIAPSIYGYREVKEAIALQMFGARQGKVLPDGGKVRADIHLLLIGDPGVAKSRLLKYVDQIAPKSIYVSGKGTTGAGLTASAEKDELADGAWTLKAGALVLAGGGIACIDEFDKMEKDDRAAMHEAMEQQSYHSKTRILLSSGEEREIGALVDGLFNERSSRIIQGRDCEIIPLEKGVLELFSSDFYATFKTSVDRVSRHKAPDRFIEITLQNGRSVTVTPEHPCWVIENGRISTKPAECVSLEDYLPVPTEIPLMGEPQEIKCFTEIQQAYSNCAVKRTMREVKKEELQYAGFPEHNDAGFCKFIGYLITDGGYELNRGTKAGVNFTNKNADLINDFCRLSEQYFGLRPYIYKRSNGVFSARIISKPLLNYLREVDYSLAEKSEHKRIPPFLMKSSSNDLRGMLSAMFECDGWATNNCVGFISPSKESCEQVQTLLLRFGIPSTILEQKTPSGKKIWRTVITGVRNLRLFSERISFLSERKNKRLASQLNPKSYRTITDIVPNVGASVHRLSCMLKVDESKVLGYSITPFKKGRQNFSKPALKKFTEALESKLNLFRDAADTLPELTQAEDIRKLRKTLNVSLEDLEGYAGTSHQNLSLIERGKGDALILRKALLSYCEYAGKAADEVTMLKRLASGKIAWSRVKKVETIPNKTEKWVYDVTVEPTRSFVSECMLLHNTISVAKAGIVARFKCNTAILAAANPKFSRFDTYKPLGEQFDIPPTLVSRFDLIFPIQDIVDRETDKKIAEHMLKMHKMIKDQKDLEPAIPTDLFRKYIAYARKNVHPLLSEEAGNMLRDYYVELRGGDRDTVRATARQLEALVRLAEASAKIRLSNDVTVDDADRAIGLTNFVLREIAMDKATGKIDIDRIATDHPKSTRDRIRSIEDAIRTIIANSPDKTAGITEILAATAEKKLERSEVEKIITELKSKGVIFEPRHDRYQFTEDA
jgi:replicative DNA helicase Mcm